MFRTDDERFLHDCKLYNYTCDVLTAEQSYSHPNPFVVEEFAKIHNDDEITGRENVDHVWKVLQSITEPYILGYSKRGETYRVLMDDKVYTRFFKGIGNYFNLLCIIAHSVWIFGGVALLVAHKTRAVHKFARPKVKG